MKSESFGRKIEVNDEKAPGARRNEARDPEPFGRRQPRQKEFKEYEEGN